MNLPKVITICEVGLRDGLQNEKILLTTDQKLELLRGVVEAGMPVVEVGSFMSPKAVPQMADTDEVFRQIPPPSPPQSQIEFRALIANVKGVERAGACNCGKVKLNVSASRAHNLANLNMTPEKSVAGFSGCAQAAQSAGIALSGSIAMVFGSPWEQEIPVCDIEAIVDAYLAMGVTEISLSDSSGMAVPDQVYRIGVAMRTKYPDVDWWMHFHNTRGTGIANLLAAMQAGMTRFDTSFAGLGGCPFVPGAAGNIATEDVLYLCERMGIETGIDFDKALAVAGRVVEIIGHPTDSYQLRVACKNQ